MGDQSILVTMLSDIQGRLGRMETSQAEIKDDVSSIALRVAIVEDHCRGVCTAVPKSATTSGTYLGLPPGTWLRYAAAALFAAYMLGTSSSQAKKTDVVLASLKKAKIQIDSVLPPTQAGD